jgi:hypothetical protein
MIAEHLHLVNSIDHLWRLVNLLVDYFDCCVVGAIGVLFEFNTVVDQEVHEPLFLFWRQKREYEGLDAGAVVLDGSNWREAARVSTVLLSLE